MVPSQRDVMPTLRGDFWLCNIVLRPAEARAISPEVSSRSCFRTLRGCTAPPGAFQWSLGSFPSGSETGARVRTNHLQHISLLSQHDLEAHSSQVGRLQTRGRSSNSGSGLAATAGRFPKVQRPYSFADALPLRQGDAMGIAGCSAQSHGTGRSERHQQAEKAPVCSSSTGRMENPRRAGSTVSNHGSHCVVLRLAYQRDPGSPMDRLRLPKVGRSDPEISSGKTPEPAQDRVFARRSPSRKQLHPCSEDVARTLRDNGTTVGLSESRNGTSMPRRLDSGRLPDSGWREARTRQDWISYVSSHLPRVAGRNGSTHAS